MNEKNSRIQSKRSVSLSRRKQKIKVLVLDPANFIGGAELFMIDFLKQAAAEKDLTFTVGTTGLSEYVENIPDGVKVEKMLLARLQPRSLRSWLDLRKSVREVSAFLKKEQIDVVFSNSVRANMIAALACKKTKKRLVWMLHDFTFPRFLLKRLGRYPAKIVCVSPAVKEYFLAATKNRFEEKIVIVPNGVDLELIQKKARAPISLPVKNPDEYWIGTVGRIEPWKGQLWFIKAARQVLQKVPGAYFFVIGAPVKHDPQSLEYHEEIKSYVQKYGLAGKIVFTGYLSNIYPLLKKLDILVHSAIEPEPFGRIVLEGMALKKTVIASPLGGPAETIEEGKTGFLVDPKDTDHLSEMMVDLCSDAPTREKIGRQAYSEVRKKYQQEGVNQSILNIMREGY